LKTAFTWRDEVGIRRGVLYEDGKPVILLK